MKKGINYRKFVNHLKSCNYLHNQFNTHQYFTYNDKKKKDKKKKLNFVCRPIREWNETSLYGKYEKATQQINDLCILVLIS